MNLVVQAALEPIAPVVAKFRALVVAMRTSRLAREELERTSEKYGVKDLQLTLDVVTRWNSTFDMLKRIGERRVPIEALVANGGEKKEWIPPEWARRPDKTDPKNALAESLIDLDFLSIQECMPVWFPVIGPSPYQYRFLSLVIYSQMLKLFSDATESLSGIKYPTSPLVLPAVWKIHNALTSMVSVLEARISLESWGARADRLKAVKAVGEALLRDLKERIAYDVPGEPIRVWMIAAYLDIRFKSLKFFKDAAAAAIALVKKWIRLEMEDHQMSLAPAVDQMPAKPQAAGDFDEFAGSDAAADEKADAVDLWDRIPASKEDPLAYWKKCPAALLPLRPYAMAYMSVQASSVESERVFSTGSLTITKGRARLTPGNASSLLMIANNSHLIPDLAAAKRAIEAQAAERKAKADARLNASKASK